VSHARPVAGSREYLLAQAEFLGDILRELAELFEAFGARRIVPTAFVRLEDCPRPGQAIAVRERRGGRTVALRQDVTAEIRRIVDRELGHLPTPYKLYYLERVWVDDPDERLRPIERIQAGVEWIGAPAAAEAQLLPLALEIAGRFASAPPTLVLGHAHLADSWTQEPRQRSALAAKSRSCWQAANGAPPDTPWLTLTADAPLPAQIPPTARTPLQELQQLGRPLQAHAQVRIDPVLAPSSPYHTGTFFEVHTGLAHDPWLRGGRYDARNRQEPDAVGFTLDLDPLVDALGSGLVHARRTYRGLWLGETPPPSVAGIRWLLPPATLDDPQAWALAHELDVVARPSGDNGIDAVDPATGRSVALETLTNT